MPTPKTNNTILFLNENPLPKIFTRGTISGKELRLRAAIREINQIHVVARRGQSVRSEDNRIGELEKKITIHLLPSWPYYLSTIPLFIVGLYWAIKLKPISIEAESPIFSGTAAILISKITKIPSIIEVRSNFTLFAPYKLKVLPISIKAKSILWLQQYSLSKATAIIYNSKYLSKQYPFPHNSSAIINPGIQYPPKKAKSSKARISICRIGYLGRLVSEKRVDLLLEAVHILQQNNKVPAFHLEIAGSGPEKKNLQKQSHNLGLDAKVSFLGRSPNFKTLSRWQFLINPNTVQAPLEMVNAEAAWLGLPVICFGNELIPETVVHNQTGIKISRPTAKALSQAISTLLSDNVLHQKLSTNGRNFARKNYNFNTQVNSLKQLYHRLKIV